MYCKTNTYASQTSAKSIFQTVHKNKLIKGRSNNAIIAACMFIGLLLLLFGWSVHLISE